MKYTRKQITEAINYWNGRLRRMDESEKAVRFFGRILTEAKLIETVENAITGFKDPKDIQNFVKKNEKNVKDAEKKVKDPSMLRKIWDTLCSAVGKGLSFIGQHWLDIIKLAALVGLAIGIPQLYNYLSAKDDVIKMAQNANRILARNQKRMDSLINGIQGQVKSTKGSQLEKAVNHEIANTIRQAKKDGVDVNAALKDMADNGDVKRVRGRGQMSFLR